MEILMEENRTLPRWRGERERETTRLRERKRLEANKKMV